jgi:hypothetical protein
VLLGLDRVGVGVFNPARYLNTGSLDFKALTTAERLNQFTGTDDGTTTGEFLYLLAIV